MKTSTVVFVIAAIVAARGSDDLIDSDKQEPECSPEGGTCIAADCPEGQLPDKSGVCSILTYEVQKTCRQRGGTCISKKKFCKPLLTIPNVSDCGSGSMCCKQF